MVKTTRQQNPVLFRVCDDCRDIVVQGYSDSIGDPVEHKNRCNRINKEILPVNHYWLESVLTDPDIFYQSCECCGVSGAQHTVQARRNKS